MLKIVFAILLVLLAIYLVPFIVYGVASAFGSLRPPETSSPARFLLGVLITKVGTAVAFVIIFSASRNVWGSQWLVYALVWFLMFALSEVGEAVAGRTSLIEAVLVLSPG